MTREVEFSQLGETLETLDYPISREDAVSELSDVTLLLADGEADLGALIAATASNEFTSVDDVISGLHNTLPREAVGEPYQSEGDS
ncbi:DUF5789 family protein [Salinigranum halophilum]|jgi:hypothetical protein|uniref:DUF5789 family protein n=1 Tax=Salinigranum halophilum TaxID=2565931 RepID=UPI0010A80125|nr:hypothetical protein [Salinigranum halophilum]